jgi:hypothetical protein
MIADQLRAAGLEAQPAAAYPVSGQRTLEREQGQAAWRHARIEPVFDAGQHDGEADVIVPVTTASETRQDAL